MANVISLGTRMPLLSNMNDIQTVKKWMHHRIIHKIEETNDRIIK